MPLQGQGIYVLAIQLKVLCISLHLLTISEHAQILHILEKAPNPLC